MEMSTNFNLKCNTVKYVNYVQISVCVCYEDRVSDMLL